MSSNTYDIKRYRAGDEMQRVIYVGRPNICLYAACRHTEEELNMACRQAAPGAPKTQLASHICRNPIQSSKHACQRPKQSSVHRPLDHIFPFI